MTIEFITNYRSEDRRRAQGAAATTRRRAQGTAPTTSGSTAGPGPGPTTNRRRRSAGSPMLPELGGNGERNGPTVVSGCVRPVGHDPYIVQVVDNLCGR